MTVQITTSVGASGGANRSEDVLRIKVRLAELGFGFFPVDDQMGPGLLMSIRLFQFVIKGQNSVGGIDGRIDPGGFTLGYLNAANAPRWVTMPLEGQGYTNFEAQQLNDHQLVAEGLCGHQPGHNNHAHVEINPPLPG